MIELKYTAILRFIKIVLIKLLVLNGSFILGQKSSLKFTHYSKQDGINQSSVNYIFQDHQHYLWIANFGGVNKFDGYKFTSYTNEFGDSTSISDNSVWTIYECSDKKLWFGTKTGLSQFHRKYNNFSNYYIKKESNNANTLAVKALFEDEKGVFYIGTEGEGVFTFNKVNQSFKKISLIPSNAKISAITEDSEGELWVGTENLGLFKINKKRNKVKKYFGANSLKSRAIWSLYADKTLNIWIGTDEDGLVKLDKKSSKFHFFIENKSETNYQSGKKIKTILKDHDNKLWIGSATKGLAYYSFKENKFYNYRKNSFEKNTLFDNDVSSLFVGYNEVLYVGFYMKGFDKIIKSPFYQIKYMQGVKNSLSNNNVYCMYNDKNQVLWFGTFGGGLNRYNLKTKEFTHYKYDEKDDSSISHDWIRIIYEDSKENLWIGTWGGGLNKFDRKTETFKRYTPDLNSDNSLNLNIITALYEDNDGELWIGTYGGGINIYQLESDDFRSIKNDKNNPNSLSDDHITSFYQDKSGVIWICTYGGGLNSYDKKKHIFKRFLPNINNEFSLNNHKTLHIFNEPDSNYFWITTLGGGINKFYYEENKFYHLTEKDGLPNNSTMGMLKDKNNNYWISSNNGISKFNPRKNFFSNFTTIDGLGSDDFNLEAFTTTNDGTMYFGGKNGITYFNPDNVKTDTNFPNVKFTKIEIDGKNHFGSDKQISFPYKSHIIIEYAAINPDKTDNISYSYQLKGQNDKWYTENKIRHLEFSDLDPGQYTLKIKSTNGHKIWNSNYSSLHIIVNPPWYMTWYFRIGLILFIIMLAYAYYKYKLFNAHQLNKKLQQKVEERTKTIQNKNKALEIEKDKTEKAYTKLKKLEDFKNELTNMIVHDLKNPLVTILSNSSKTSSNSDLKSINKSGKLMLNLIENMLEIQKFENIKIKLNFKPYNFRTILNEAINNVVVLCEDKRIRIKTEIDEKIYVSIDEEIILRVIINLFTNAIKFSPSDSEIVVKANNSEKNSKYITITIEDQGKGIPKDLQDSIFDKFSQVESVSSGKIKSTGLGLTFCRMAVELHKGEIWVDSIIDRGSKFSFSIPLYEGVIDQTNESIKLETPIIDNPLSQLILNDDEISVLSLHSKKIKGLTIYEMGEWMEIFEEIEKIDSPNLQKWKSLMFDSLTNFDENAFNYLVLLTEKQRNSAS